ncbi:serine O-acetyltransferase [Priestia megaterium]|uniref:serine O-acetyltransferase n=1 Tax=Priestia megaterium TaxID=1404 RepID=UPI003EEB1D5D
MNVYKLYKLSRQFQDFKIPVLPKLVTYSIRLFFGCFVPYSAKIGEGTKLGYGGIGIVIHSRAVIGKNCIINSGVTIGGTTKKRDVPILGDNVYVGSGAKILGPVVVGDNVVIGANAVVTKSVPDNCMVAGIPAKIIKKDININNYL